MDKFKIIKINTYIKKIGTNNRGAVYDLYDMIGSNLYYVAFKYMGNEHDTDDLIADFWADIFDICKKFHFDKNGYSYLCTTVRNRALNKLKAEGKKMAISLESIDAYECIDFGQRNEILDIETKITVESALKNLDDDEKDIIYKIYWEGKTIREIAKEEDMSKSQVDRLKHRAVDKMKEIMDKISWDKMDA